MLMTSRASLGVLTAPAGAVAAQERFTDPRDGYRYAVVAIRCVGE